MRNAQPQGASCYSVSRQAVRIALVSAVSLAGIASSAGAQPCNPIVDGTYCAEQMPRNRAPAPSSSSSGYATPMRSIGADLSLGPGYLEQPATIGAITFRGNNQSCVGLLFRGNCN